MNIKKGDKVYIIKGNSRGKTGNVGKVLPGTNSLIVAGINIHKKHLKKSQKNPQGGIIDINSPMPRANVVLICPRCDKSTKVSHKLVGNNKSRICKKCGESVDESK